MVVSRVFRFFRVGAPRSLDCLSWFHSFIARVDFQSHPPGATVARSRIWRATVAQVGMAADETLDEMACFVQLFVKIARRLAIAFGRDYWRLFGRQERFDHTLVGIERFVCQHDIGFHLREERICAFEIMRLTRG